MQIVCSQVHFSQAIYRRQQLVDTQNDTRRFWFSALGPVNRHKSLPPCLCLILLRTTLGHRGVGVEWRLHLLTYREHEPSGIMPDGRLQKRCNASWQDREGARVARRISSEQGRPTVL